MAVESSAAKMSKVVRMPRRPKISTNRKCFDRRQKKSGRLGRKIHQSDREIFRNPLQKPAELFWAIGCVEFLHVIRISARKRAMFAVRVISRVRHPGVAQPGDNAFGGGRLPHPAG